MDRAGEKAKLQKELDKYRERARPPFYFCHPKDEIKIVSIHNYDAICRYYYALGKLNQILKEEAESG